MSKQIDVLYAARGDVQASVCFDDFHPTEQAFPSSRALSGSDDFWAECEYLERGEIVVAGEKRPAERVFLFSDADIHSDDGEPLAEEDYPWDAEHCARILLRD
jgi:hypothetical protein